MPLVTFHDIGTNLILQNFTVYHICAPGHEDNSATIDVNASPERENLLKETTTEELSIFRILKDKSLGYVLGDKYSPAFRYPTMDELTDVVHSVVTHFGLKYFIGFGVGAGSNILARYAIKHQDNVQALFLINPDASTHSYYQYMKMHFYDVPQMNSGFISDNILNQLEWHWFGYNQNLNLDLTEYYQQLMRSLNPRNVAGFIDSFLQRNDLGLVRDLSLEETIVFDEKNPKNGKAIKADVMLITGNRAHDHARNLAEMNGRMDPNKTQFLIMEDCNGMLMEEHPDQLAVNFLNFLRTISLMIRWTPEKLFKEAEILQNDQIKLMDRNNLAQISIVQE